MEASFLSHYLNIKREQSKENLGIILFKPEWMQSEIENFRKYCVSEMIDIIEERDVVLSKNAVIALYKNIFSYSADDLSFGIEWKAETIKYLTSGSSLYFLVRGELLGDKLSKYKYVLRDKYRKITNPKKLLNVIDFKEKVIKNIIHVVDVEDLQNALWTLFYP